MGNTACCVCSWIGCGCRDVEDQPVAEIKQPKDRHCTDVLWLLAYFAGWIAVITIFATAAADGGDPNRLLHGIDYRGRTCGSDSGVVAKEFAAWPYPPEWQFIVCVEKCEDTTTEPLMTFKQFSTEFVYWCIPVFNASVSVELSGDFDSASEAASRAIGDIFIAWPVIFTSIFVALIFSFCYTAFVKRCAGCMVWFTAMVMVAAGTIVAYVFLEKAKEYDEEEDEADNRARAVRILGWCTAGATLLFLCIIIALRNQIRVAIGVIKLSAKALEDMKLLVAFPLIPLFVGCAYAVWWIAVSLYIFSVGEFFVEPIPDTVVNGNGIIGPNPAWQALVAAGANYSNFKWNEELKESFAIHFFHLLWTVQFLIYFTYLVCAGAVADWYFTRVDDQGHKMRGTDLAELGAHPIRDSCCRAARFHLGSIAVGSFIIAVIQFARAMVKYIEEQSKAASQNQMQKCVLRCIGCCLWCAECCMDKINKNAFIWMSIYGDNFGTSCCSSFSLVWNNLIRAAAINLVGGYLMLLGKITVALLTAGGCGLFMVNNDHYEESLSSVVMPVVVIFILSYMVASLFMVTFETTIDVTFFCFLVDEEANKKSGTMFASEELQKLVGSYSEQNKALTKRTLTLRNFGRDKDHQQSVRGLDDDDDTTEAKR